MAIAFDSTQAPTRQIGVSTFSWTHTCTGSNRILWILVDINNNANTDIVTGVTYNSITLTKIDRIFSLNNGNISLWYLINPTIGANTATITTSTNAAINGISASYTGAKQSGVPDATTTLGPSSTATFVQSTTSVADNCWMVWGTINANGVFVAGTNTTIRGSDAGNGSCLADSNAAITPAGSFSMTETGAASGWAGIQASFAPSTGGGTTVLPFKTLLGVGI